MDSCLNLEKGNSYNRIFNVSDNDLSDIYPLLRLTDVLITDYSSVFVDFLLLNKPIIFAPFDIDDYLTKDTMLCYDYNEITPGYKAKNWIDVERAMVNCVKNPEQFEKERLAVCDRLNTYQDGKTCERVFQQVINMMES